MVRAFGRRLGGDHGHTGPGDGGVLEQIPSHGHTGPDDGGEISNETPYLPTVSNLGDDVQATTDAFGSILPCFAAD